VLFQAPPDKNMLNQPQLEVFTTDQPHRLINHLRAEYESQQELFNLQPALIQRFLQSQAGLVAEGLTQNYSLVRFTLPSQVLIPDPAMGEARLRVVPADSREQLAGGLLTRLVRASLNVVLSQRLSELEAFEDPATAASARLMRHAVALYLVNQMLPAGRSVTYLTAGGEDIPTIPYPKDNLVDSAITASSDAITQQGHYPEEPRRGELQVPYAPYARLFYLPQWVAFDDPGKLLLSSLSEAEAKLASMQRFMQVLRAAIELAPYMVADDVYQQKKYGMLGQLINQGRLLALFQANQIITVIQRRSAANDLNRGLSISLPYFNDQALEIHLHNFMVIPAGRIKFSRALVVSAVREEEAKAAQDTRLNPSTRKHLLIELRALENAFIGNYSA
jgi:hypothetical protein